MKFTPLFTQLLLLLSAVTVGHADLLLVPGQYSTIQGALDAAATGDSVLVAPGTYHENLIFPPVDLTLTSENGPAETVIDGNGVSHVVRFDQGQSRGTLLTGFTLSNGNSPLQGSVWGGGIYCRRSSPRILDNRIEANSAFLGGGICSYEASPLIQGNSFEDNSAHRGGAVYCYGGEPELADNFFSGNSCSDNGGGGAVALDFCRGTLERNSFLQNSALAGGSLHCRLDSSVVIRNTLTLNSAITGSALFCRYSGTLFEGNIISSNQGSAGVESRNCLPGFSCNDIWGNSGGDAWVGEDLGGNFSQDPLLCDPESGDLRLQEESPCWTDDCGVVGASSQNCEGDGLPVNVILPAAIQLHQNFPNPFNPVTIIEFTLPSHEYVELAVYNTIGQQITVLADGVYASGTHGVEFDASVAAGRTDRPLSSGVYIYRLQAGQQVVSRKMMLLQ